MKFQEIKNNIFYCGLNDCDRRIFDELIPLEHGTSYNSYLVKGSEKTAIIDTMYPPKTAEYLKRFAENQLGKVDYIIANHGEQDHSGSIPALLEKFPNAIVLTNPKCAENIKNMLHVPSEKIREIADGEEVSLGDKTLKFIFAPGVHWPDTMFAYLDKENVLFSSDGFGQHLASEYLYADEVEQDILYKEALKYYANILAPFGIMVDKKIKEILSMNLQIDMICPSHGLIWRKEPTQIVEKYLEWANKYQEEQITIIYDTMWNDTRKMAEAIAKGIQEKDEKVTIKLMNTAKDDKTDVLTEVFKSKMILVGSPTVNNGYLHSIAGILEMIKGMKLKGKKAVAFGSYGWSGEAVKLITEELRKSGFEIVNDGIRCMWTPDSEAEKELIEFGKSLV